MGILSDIQHKVDNGIPLDEIDKVFVLIIHDLPKNEEELATSLSTKKYLVENVLKLNSEEFNLKALKILIPTSYSQEVYALYFYNLIQLTSSILFESISLPEDIILLYDGIHHKSININSTDLFGVLNEN